MKAPALSVLLSSLLFLFSAAVSAQEAPSVLRVASYNILHCSGIHDCKSVDPDRTAEVIRALDADVCSLQEVDCKMNRSGKVDQTAVLAEKTDRFGTFSPAINADGGEYGVALLSKQSPQRVEFVPLPGKEEKRTLLIAEFDDFVLFNTHLSLKHPSRVESAEIISRKLSEQKKPVILTGDMNVSGEEEREELFGKEWTVLTAEAPTFPSDGPRARLDYILIADPTGNIPAGSEHFSGMVLSAKVVDAPNISDHLPVLVELDRSSLKPPRYPIKRVRR